MALLAYGLGRKTMIDWALTKHALGKLKAKYILVAGLIYAIDQIKQDSLDAQTKVLDTLWQCGVSLKDKGTPEDLFKDKKVPGGYFEISYPVDRTNLKDKVRVYGFQDEERRLNLNGITPVNVRVLVELIVLLGFDEKTASIIASSIADWHDEDIVNTNDLDGAEDVYYQGLKQPYHVKNASFDSIEELWLVRGMTPEIFQKLKHYVTVFPKKGGLLVNFETAYPPVLQALARSVSGPQTQTGVEDADSLASKVAAFRVGKDGQAVTSDDQVIDMNNMALNAKEMVIFLLLTQYRTPISNFIRMEISGVEEAGRGRSKVEAVLQRSDSSIVYWRRK